MARDPNVGVGVAVVVVRGRRVLMSQRRSGLWQVPGGWVDWGEQPEQAAARELVEETGLADARLTSLGATGMAHDAGGIWSVTVFYRADVSGEPDDREPQKHGPWRWVDRDALPTPLFCPDYPRMVEAAFRAARATGRSAS